MIAPWHRRKLAIRGAALTAFLAYFASFAVVHHRAWQRRQDWGIDCLMLTEVTDLQSWHAHRRLAVFFAPLYWQRSASTGQPGPCVNEPLFELSSNESHPPRPAASMTARHWLCQCNEYRALNSTSPLPPLL
ncbi:MAG TPA: hypothetical protein VM452_11690, partial [Caulifigura sp.]|nr:hypothetical protein [Caulifigura sp.]